MKPVKLFEEFILENIDNVADSFIDIFNKLTSSHKLDDRMNGPWYKPRHQMLYIEPRTNGKPDPKLEADFREFGRKHGFNLELEYEEDLGYGEYSYGYTIEEISEESNEVDMSLQSKMARKYEKWERGLISIWGGTLYIGYHSDIPKSGKVQPLNQLKRDLIDFMKLKPGSNEYYETDEWFAEGGYRGGVPLFTKTMLDEIYMKIAKKTPAPFDFTIYRTSDKEEDGINSYTTLQGAYARNNSTEMAYLIPRGTPIIFAGVDADANEIIWIPTKSELKKYRIQ